MAMNTSLSSIPASQFGPVHARHLLRRAGFGPEAGQAAKLARLGLDRAVDQLLDYEDIDASHLPDPPVDPNVLHPLSDEQRRALRIARKRDQQQVLQAYRKQRMEMRRADRRMFGELRKWWLARMIETPRPMQERLTLLWHDHFATRYRDVRDAYMVYQQNAMFRAHANGSFVKLAQGIVRDPAMLKFLNNDRNNRRNPNENLARELMELFTLGEGHYSERDIKEAARALTGYHVQDDDFAFNQRAHDPGEKTILGREARFNGDTLVRHLLRRRETLAFVAFKLYRHFVADVGDVMADVPKAHQPVILDIARDLRDHEYNLKPVLRRILKSRHFYDPQIVGRQIKSPVNLVVGTMRMMHTPQRNLGMLGRSMRLAGQDLFNPPSVAGWDGGASWINTSTLFARQNICTYLLTGKLPQQRRWNYNDKDYDPMVLLKHQQDRSPKAVVDALIDRLLGDHIPPQRREPLVSYMQGHGKTIDKPEPLVKLLLLITAMPEYQLC